MCGIGGLVNTAYGHEEIADILWLIADRGMHAGGMAWTQGDKIKTFKDSRSTRAMALDDSILYRVDLDCPIVMLHARYATQGSITDNRNNHPILYDNIVLTHNGVLRNDGRILGLLGKTRRYEVDTEAIAAALKYKGIAWAMKHIRGSMSLAWMDRNDPFTLNLCTNGENPLVIAKLDDGGHAYASSDYMISHLGWTEMWNAKPFRHYKFLSNGDVVTKDLF